MIDNLWDFISQEPNLFGSLNLVCENLSASSTSRNLLDLEFRSETVPSWVTAFFPGEYFPNFKPNFKY